jgi:hypothetical protein
MILKINEENNMFLVIMYPRTTYKLGESREGFKDFIEQLNIT